MQIVAQLVDVGGVQREESTTGGSSATGRVSVELRRATLRWGYNNFPEDGKNASRSKDEIELTANKHQKPHLTNEVMRGFTHVCRS